MADDMATATADPDSQPRRSTGLVNVPGYCAVESVVPVLCVWDTARSVAWYEGLGFRRNWVSRVPPGTAFVSLLCGEHVELYLSEHNGDGWPKATVCLAVDNLEQVAAEYGVDIVGDGTGREVRLCDPDGNRLRVTAARAG
ncbi:MAG: glyoxalase superfamily protein [Sciscionella sp.]